MKQGLRSFISASDILAVQGVVVVGDPVSSRSISLFNHLRFCVLWKLWNVGSSGNT